MEAALVEIKAGLEMIKEIHLAGAFSVPDIINYNLTHRSETTFPTFFPFWKILPGAMIRQAGEAPAFKGAALVVINLNGRVWDEIEGLI